MADTIDRTRSLKCNPKPPGLLSSSVWITTGFQCQSRPSGGESWERLARASVSRHVSCSGCQLRRFMYTGSVILAADAVVQKLVAFTVGRVRAVSRFRLSCETDRRTSSAGRKYPVVVRGRRRSDVGGGGCDCLGCRNIASLCDAAMSQV